VPGQCFHALHEGKMSAAFIVMVCSSCQTHKSCWTMTYSGYMLQSHISFPFIFMTVPVIEGY